MKKTAAVFYFSLLSVLTILFLQIAYFYTTIPDKFLVSGEEDLQLNTVLHVSAKELPRKTLSASTNSDNSKTDMMLMLYGIVPIKRVEVNTVNVPQLIPSGEPFGLKMLTEGVIVTDFGTVECASGSFSPAKNAGLEIGDVIVEANGAAVNSSADLLNAIQLQPENVSLKVKRGTQIKEIVVNAEKSLADGLYKLGMWTRDSCAGIGTITYYDAENSTYAGLGHAVCDIATGQILPLSSGSIVPVCISEVNKSIDGYPGELCGSFISSRSIGTIESNNNCGVYGYIDEIPSGKTSVPMAFKQEVEAGAATILCTIGGLAPKEYDIIIESVNAASDNYDHNMVIKITDPELLSVTGGIVQGMSGSPIMQNGKLVGAVTHVFVNDVTKGYAIFAENMYSVSSEFGKSGENAA